MTGADDHVELELDAVQVDSAAGVGRVVAAGARAEGLLGRRVLVGPIDPCGECEVCRRGGAAVCPHARRRDGLGERAVVAARWLVPLDGDLELASPGAAAVAGDVARAYTLYARTGVAPREPVVVVGRSPVARFLIEILLGKGIAPAAIAETGAWTDWLLGKGVAVGVDRAALIDGFAAQGLGGRPWRVLCAEPAAIALAGSLAGPRATLTVLAGPAPRSEALRTIELDGELLAREATIIGVAEAHPDLVVEAAAMCVKGEVDLVGGTTTDETVAATRTHVRTLRASHERMG